MKINWNGFLKEAVENYPNESCAFLFTNKPYSPDEEWTVFSVKNVSKIPKEEWIPDKNEMIEVKRKATKLGLIKIGNIHTHPYAEEFDIGEQKLPSQKDLFFARRFNDIVRGILVIGKGMILACHLHDKSLLSKEQDIYVGFFFDIFFEPDRAKEGVNQFFV